MAVIAAILLVCTAALAAWRSLTHPPEPSGRFSADSAHATLGELLREGKPHPVGSPENAVVRQRIVERLTQLGYQPRIQSRFQCTSYGCCQVENVIAVRAGTQPGQAVVAMAHYDSVVAGPGAGDDGSGVAVLLELAKMLSSKPAARNDLILLFTDGEEFGLNGASAFVEEAPEYKTVRAVINVEARGSSGPSVMFETGANNAALIELFAEVIERPVTNSLAYEIYKRLPNDTDFSSFRNAGHIGFNLAFLGDAARYHSQNDTVDRLSKGSLAHHGENALALVEKLTSIDLATIKAEGDASYFDLFGRILIRWPAGWNLPLAALALLLISGLLGRQRSSLGARKTAWALGLTILTGPLLFGAGWLLSFPLGRWPQAMTLDHPSPWPARVALLACALLIALALGAALARRQAGALAGWLALSSVGLVVAVSMPGAAYAFLIPSLAYALLGWALASRPRGAWWATVIASALAAVLWLGHSLNIESALGFQQAAIRAVVLMPLVWCLTSLWAQALAAPGSRAILPGALLAIALAASTALAAIQDTASVDRPRGLNINYQVSGEAPPRWRLISENPISNDYLEAHGFTHAPAESRREHAVAEKPAPVLELPKPSFTAEPTREAQGRRVISGVVRFAAGSPLAGLTIGPNSGVRGLRIEGQEVWREADLKSGAERALRIGGVGDRPLRFELVLDATAKGPVTLYHRLPLPQTPESKALVAGRPADTLPFGAGDGATVTLPLVP